MLAYLLALVLRVLLVYFVISLVLRVFRIGNFFRTSKKAAPEKPRRYEASGEEVEDASFEEIK